MTMSRSLIATCLSLAFVSFPSHAAWVSLDFTNPADWTTFGSSPCSFLVAPTGPCSLYYDAISGELKFEVAPDTIGAGGTLDRQIAFRNLQWAANDIKGIRFDSYVDPASECTSYAADINTNGFVGPQVYIGTQDIDGVNLVTGANIKRRFTPTGGALRGVSSTSDDLFYFYIAPAGFFGRYASQSFDFTAQDATSTIRDTLSWKKRSATFKNNGNNKLKQVAQFDPKMGPVDTSVVGGDGNPEFSVGIIFSSFSGVAETTPGCTIVIKGIDVRI